jgi:PAS domain S-box-containing protein
MMETLTLSQALSGRVFQHVVEDHSDLVLLKDLEGRYIYLNRSCIETIGRPLQDVIGKTDLELFGPEVADEIEHYEQILLATGEPQEYHLRYPGVDRVIRFHCRKFLLHDEDGKPIGMVGISRNVTSEKLAEEKYRFIFDNAPVAFWEEDFSDVKTYLEQLKEQGVTDLRAFFQNDPAALIFCIELIRINDVNLATMRMNRAESKPQFITDIKRKFTPESEQLFIEEFVALAEGKTFFCSEASTIQVGSDQLDVLFNFNVLPGHEEDLSQVLISVIDITALKQTEKQLSQLKELYRSVVEGQREMICRFLPSGIITFYNPAFELFFGNKGTALTECSFLSLFPEMDTDCSDALSRLSPEAPMCTTERHNYDTEGAMVWQQWSINALFNEWGEVTEYQAVGTDITERKETQTRLAASEARWRSVFENAEDLIFTVNSAGLILSANEQASMAAGQRLAGTVVGDLMGKANRIVARRAVQKVFDTGKRVRQELKIDHGPWTGMVLSCVITPMLHDGRVLSATVIARDITESRRLENRVREALIEGQENERKRVSQELHDGLGQLFTAIKLNMQHLRKGVEHKVEDETMQRLELLEQNISVAINEVKHISHNLMPDVLEQFGLKAALEDLVRKWNVNGRMHITLEVIDLFHKLDAQMELALYRMAQELITNAVRHSGASAIFVQLIDYGKSLVLMVEDDGRGFDVEMDRGGLGLRNIRSRAELLDGTVDIDSSPGKGTVTTVEIPIKPWE